MKLWFSGDVDELENGIETISEVLNFQITNDGLEVNAVKKPGAPLSVKFEGGKATITYAERIHFYRAVGLLIEHLLSCGDNFDLNEEPQFTMNGVMFDVSQGNAVINICNVKNILNTMAIMGLNMMMLYAEDSFEIKDEPYFGYMRSRYTYDELKELDNYAYALGIEIIPCVQTLAHLIDAIKWARFGDIKDDEDTLLVGEPETYDFIEKIISSASAPFRSKRIHIGMDEAYKLGQGEYLLKNGLRSKFDIMSEHLDNIVKITDKLGLVPMIWSDMYFRAGSPINDYYDTKSVFPSDIANKKPSNVQMVYWDYEHSDESFYKAMIERHRLFGSDPIFAGGLWSWTGFSANYGITITNSTAALNACKENGIKEVFTTVWGDDSVESNIYLNLLGMQLYAEHGYCKKPDEAKLKSRFNFCTGCNYDDFLNFSLMDEIPGCKKGNPKNANPSKYLMWQDAMCGLFDKNVEGRHLSEHYAKVEKLMSEAIGRNGRYDFLFEFMKKASSVLSLKAEIGLKMKAAYDSGDKLVLRKIVDDTIPQIIERIKELRKYHRELWLKINKPIGWDILDGRYGFLVARLDSAAFRLHNYLDGSCDILEELEEKRLYFNGIEDLVSINVYNRMPSASRISMSTFYLV